MRTKERQRERERNEKMLFINAISFDLKFVCSLTRISYLFLFFFSFHSFVQIPLREMSFSQTHADTVKENSRSFVVVFLLLIVCRVNTHTKQFPFAVGDKATDITARFVL